MKDIMVIPQRRVLGLKDLTRDEVRFRGKRCQ